MKGWQRHVGSGACSALVIQPRLHLARAPIAALVQKRCQGRNELRPKGFWRPRQEDAALNFEPRPAVATFRASTQSTHAGDSNLPADTAPLGHAALHGEARFPRPEGPPKG